MAGVVASTAGNETSVKSSGWAAEMVRLITLTRARRWLQLSRWWTGWQPGNGGYRRNFPLPPEPRYSFGHGHYHQNQVPLHAERHDRGQVRLREVLLLLPGASGHPLVQRWSVLLPALPPGVRLQSLGLGRLGFQVRNGTTSVVPVRERATSVVLVRKGTTSVVPERLSGPGASAPAVTQPAATHTRASSRGQGSSSNSPCAEE
jgi:hypothetical protein